jgi:hypothetical protein
LIGGNTPYQKISINTNETISVPYHVNKGPTWPYEEWGMSSPSLYGYMILELPEPGSYHMVISTNSPGDMVGAQWAETFQENAIVGNKFETYVETRTMFHWIGSTVYTCKSDRYSDCTMDMSLANYQMNPEIQIYITGHGDGNITITRTG